MTEAVIQIRKPNDSGQYWKTTVSCDTFSFRSTSISSNRSGSSDGILAGISDYWKGRIRNNSVYRYTFDSEFSHLVTIGTLPILLQKQKTRYSMNGVTTSLAEMCNVLAKVTYKSCFEDDPAKLMQYLYSSSELPENVTYAIENRVPYHWIELTESINKIKVRLNVQQISEKEVAIEVSDGVWGTMSIKDLDVFCNFYRHGKKRGSWKNISPKELYYRTVGRIPSESELLVMKEFLKQNRTSKIVEERAIELVNELLDQYPDNLKAEWKGETLDKLYVKGKDYDWLLTNNKFKSEIQQVSTFVYQPSMTGEEYEWRGPICIDNMSRGSSLGDQFAARALALLNDTIAIQIVSTIRRYIVEEPNKNRVDLNEV